MNTPDIQRAFGTPASHLSRFVASLLDGFILIALTAPVAVMMSGSLSVAMLATFLATLAYFAYSHASRWQATPGKYIMRLHVTDAQQQRLSLRRSLERALAYLLPFLPQYTSLSEAVIGTLVMWIGMLWFMPIFYTRTRSGVHDMLCRTRVVNGRVEA